MPARRIEIESDDEEREDQEQYEEIQDFPLLSKTRAEIDPFVDDPARNDGPDRLLAVRQLLERLRDELFTEPQPNLVEALGATQKTREAVLRAVLSDDPASTGVRVRLVAPTAAFVSTSLYDDLPYEKRCNWVAVRGEGRIALRGVPGAPPLQPPSVIMEIPDSVFGTSNSTGSSSITIELEGGDEERLTVTAAPSQTQYEQSADAIPLAAHFGPFSSERAAIPHSLFSRELPLPSALSTAEGASSSNRLPDRLAHRVATLWHDRLHFGAVHRALHLEGHPRQFVVDDVCIVRGVGRRKQTEIRATMHSMSLQCMCSLHRGSAGADRCPPCGPHEKIRSVRLTIGMCGSGLVGPCGECPQHQSHTLRCDGVPGVCCANSEAHVRCFHQTADGAQALARSHALDLDRFDPVDLVELRLLVAATSAWYRVKGDQRTSLLDWLDGQYELLRVARDGYAAQDGLADVSARVRGSGSRRRADSDDEEEEDADSEAEEEDEDGGRGEDYHEKRNEASRRLETMLRSGDVCWRRWGGRLLVGRRSGGGGGGGGRPAWKRLTSKTRPFGGVLKSHTVWLPEFLSRHEN